MSFHLGLGTVPENLSIKAAGPFVLIGEYRVSLIDFLLMAEYVLENNDLEPDDPRLIFISRIRKIREAPGWNRTRRRLVVRGGPAYLAWRARAEANFFAELTAIGMGHKTAHRAKAKGAKKGPRG